WLGSMRSIYLHDVRLHPSMSQGLHTRMVRPKQIWSIYLRVSARSHSYRSLDIKLLGGNMKTLNTHWKVIALGTFAVMVTIWAGGRMEAKSGQDYAAQSARVRPQVREAATNLIGPIG